MSNIYLCFSHKIKFIFEDVNIYSFFLWSHCEWKKCVLADSHTPVTIRFRFRKLSSAKKSAKTAARNCYPAALLLFLYNGSKEVKGYNCRGTSLFCINNDPWPENFWDWICWFEAIVKQRPNRSNVEHCKNIHSIKWPLEQTVWHIYSLFFTQ